MIAKKIPMRNARLSSFEGLVTYLSSSQGVHNRVGKIEMHGFQSQDLQWAIQEALVTQDQNKRSGADKTYHLMVSFATDENLNDEELTKIEQSMVDALGFGEHQRVSVVHRDTDNLHFHVAINKVHPDKFTVHEPYNDFKILGEECRKFESLYGLQQVERGRGRQKSIDMEEVAGVESLLGWIRRECADQIGKAQSWEALHQVMAEHGLEIKQRGNGFIFTDGTHHVKASSVEREFSKAKLEERLGSYRDADGNEGKPAVEPKKKYQKNPISQIDVSGLYDQYRAERATQKERRDAAFQDLMRLRNDRIASIQDKYAFRRNLIKYSGTGIAKRLLYKMLFRQMRREMSQVHMVYRSQRTEIYQSNRQLAWADWLKKKAVEGDLSALEALRRRGKKAEYKGNRLEGMSGVVVADLNVDTVTKKGTVIYSEDALTIRDTGTMLKLAAIPDDRAVARALEIAIARYGESLNINGTQHFREKVAKVAAAKGMRIVFTDAELNHRYQQHLKEFEHVRRRVDRYRNPVAAVGDDERRRGGEGGGRSGSGGGSGKSARTGRLGRWGDVRGRDGGIHAGLSRIAAGTEFVYSGSLGAGGKQNVASGGYRLRGVSERGLVFVERRTEMLLPRYVPRHMEQPRAANLKSVRWPIYRPGRKLATVADVRAIQAVVGQVAKPGHRPPVFRRDGLAGIGNLAPLSAGSPVAGGRLSKSVQAVVPTASAASVEMAAKPLTPADKYILERQEKMQKGFDIVNYRGYNAGDVGRFTFKGLRHVDGQALALLKAPGKEEIVVMPVSPYMARKLSGIGLEAEVQVTANGQVRIQKSRTR